MLVRSWWRISLFRFLQKQDLDMNMSIRWEQSVQSFRVLRCVSEIRGAFSILVEFGFFSHIWVIPLIVFVTTEHCQPLSSKSTHLKNSRYHYHKNNRLHPLTEIEANLASKYDCLKCRLGDAFFNFSAKLGTWIEQKWSLALYNFQV